jgi:hypothetical protein
MSKSRLDQPIPFSVVDPSAPIPYRVRVLPPSLELLGFVVPVLGIRPMGREIPKERASEVRVARRRRVA